LIRENMETKKIRITFIEHNGKEHTVEASPGRSVMHTAVDNMVPGIVAECGGCLSCGTCHGYIDPAWQERLKGPAEDEVGMLEFVKDPQPNSRLVCQIEVSAELDGLVIRLPSSQF
jgi:ferredoxin, 2Fe-2S